MSRAIDTPWPAEARYLRTGDLLVDLYYRRILGPSEAESTEIPQRIFDLLLVLMAEPRRLHTRSELFDRLWPGLVVEDANLSQNIWLLRRALGEERKHWLRTVAKGGYEFQPPGPVEWLMELPAEMTADPASAAPPPLAEPTPDASAIASPAAAQATPPPATPHRWWVGAAVAALLLGIAIAGVWLSGGTRKPAVAPASKPVSIALVAVEAPGTEPWPVTLLYEWTRWKLSSLPQVTLLTEAELAAGANAPDHTVFLISREDTNRAGELRLDARFKEDGKEVTLSAAGPRNRVAELVDQISRELVTEFAPAHSQRWPRLELDERAARRYADFASAMNRRDWMAAAAIGDDVVRQAPRFGLAYAQLARAQDRLAQKTAAVESMERARDLLEPVPAEVSELLSAQILAMDPQRYPKAAEAYRTLVARYPRQPAYAVEFASLLNRTGRPREALDLLTAQAYDTAPLGARIAHLLTLASAYQSMGDPDRMAQTARAAEELARRAGAGWELERAQALIYVAGGENARQRGDAAKPLFEQAAQLFESAGNSTGALYARYVAEVFSGAAPVPGRLDALLAQAHAGGYREMEINILFKRALQLHGQGDIPGYRRQLERAAGVAAAAGDLQARNRLEILQTFDDLLGARLDNAGRHLQRLRGAGLEGDLAVNVDKLAATRDGILGKNREALQALDHAEAGLPPAAAGEPLSAVRATLACVRTDRQLSLGDLAGARKSAARCAEASDELVAAMVRASVELNAGDKVAARHHLQRAQAILSKRPGAAEKWFHAIGIAELATRLGDYADSDKLLKAVLPEVRPTGYTLLVGAIETGLSENAAARGDWASSRLHADAARAVLPPGAWYYLSRLDMLDAAEALAAGDRARTARVASAIHDRAHELDDVARQLEVHSLLQTVGLPSEHGSLQHEALIARTGMRGASTDWLNLKPVR